MMVCPTQCKHLCESWPHSVQPPPPSTSAWYSLGYVESVEGVRRGAKLLQIGVGSGVKCGLNVWQALHDIRDVQDAWEHRLAPEEAAAVKTAWAKKQARMVRRSRSLGMLTLLMAMLVVLVALLGQKMSVSYL